MTRKIHNAILVAALITFIVSILIILGVSYPLFNNELEAEIESETEYLAAGVEIGGVEYLKSFSEEHRITLINTDGAVIYDTLSGSENMENHKDREEVKEAFENGEGKSSRYSSTLTKKTFNYAKLLSDGTVLRVSNVRYTLGAVVLRMLAPMTAALIVVTLISAILSNSLAKKIVKPINEIDFENSDISDDYTELSPLLHRITRQNDLIKLQMQDLKRRQEEFLTITHNMSEGLILIGSKTEVLSHNKSALKLLDVTKADLGDSILSFTDNKIFSDAVATALEGTRTRPLMETNGKTLQIYANPVFLEDNVSGAVLLIMDVTEREQRDAMRREFTSNVSHELKTPLTSIYGISDMMQNGIVRPEDMTKFARDIHEESARLITLVNDIIKLSRLDESTDDVEKAEVDLLACSKEVADRLSMFAQEQDISLSVEGEPLVIVGIPSVISEMIYNLCDNAIKYNRPGGRVDITVSEKDSLPFVCIRDTGIGIPKEHQERVFERFWRVDKSHSKSIGGTGLGLSIVKHGAAVHSAKIKLESREGEGTSITLTFPHS